MEAIFHEKQEGSLCAQHCLNALLQGSYFTPVDLATLAQQMDDEERLRMSESGVDSEDYRRFLEQPSGNYDDSGYFSVQVISSALRVWGLELVPYNSTEERAIEAQRQPAEMQAYICNYRDHWFTIRRLGNQWFNLNSLLTSPELITDTYLAMFLAQLQQEGFSIFVVFGTLPECEADTLLRITPAVQTQKPRVVPVVVQKIDDSENEELQKALRLSLGQVDDSDHVIASTSKSANDEHELKKALRLSLNSIRREVEVVDLEDNEDELQKALRLSLTGASPTTSAAPVTVPESPSSTDEQLQEALRLSLQNDGYIDSESADLERAMRMSLECCESTRADPEEVRRKRLAYLERRDNTALPCLVPDARVSFNT